MKRLPTATGALPRDQAPYGWRVGGLQVKTCSLSCSYRLHSLRSWSLRQTRRGSRPSAPHDQRTRSAYIFGAICPKFGKAAALVMPWCDTHAMTQHLAEISRHVAHDAHAILIMDQAGWHMSNTLIVPENITILPLPPKSPELNPVENLWQFMRDNWLSNRVFKSYDDIVDHCCDAWRKLENQPWRVMSIGRREWASGF